MTETKRIEYEGYGSLVSLVADLARGYVLYQAPLDSRPYTIKVKRFTYNCEEPQKSTLTFWTSETKTLTVDMFQHFDRFMRRGNGIN